MCMEAECMCFNSRMGKCGMLWIGLDGMDDADTTFIGSDGSEQEPPRPEPRRAGAPVMTS